jgi:lipid II:glycine glycyltransferase (peptidoglycan interpeptide bridge formation enzyme)
MKLVELFESEKNKYEGFLAENLPGAFLQSWEWGSWQESLQRQVKRYAVVDEKTEWIGVMSLIIQRVPVLGFHYLYLPHGPVLKTGIDVDAGIIFDMLGKNFPNCFCIRSDATGALKIDKERLQKSQTIQPQSTFVNDLKKDKELVLKEMHHKTRYNIGVAQKHGVTVQVIDELSPIFDEALMLIVETSKRQGFRSHEVLYYKNLVRFFNSLPKAKLYTSNYGGRVLASAIMLDYGHRRTYLFGGSSSFDKQVMAPYLLHFSAMIDAKDSGMTEYDWWGAENASGQTPGFVRFKQGFGGDLVQFPGTFDYVTKQGYYFIYKLFRGFGKFI